MSAETAAAPDRPAPAAHWAAVHGAAAAIAALADQPPRIFVPWEDMAGEAPPWRLARAELELADLAAVMRTGLAAVLSIQSRGGDPRLAAMALLAEFGEAEHALGSLLRRIS